MKVFILASAAVLLICAAQAQKLKRQDDQYDYDDQAQHQQPEIQSARARPQNFQQASKQQPHPKPIGKDGETSTWIPILHYNKEQENDGSYKTNYETGNNIQAEESGYLKDLTEDNPTGTLVQKGSYSYEAPDGQLINVQYQADENGFRVFGDHLPTPPPIPEEIQKGLDQIYEGIRLNAEKAERERKNNPNYDNEQEANNKKNYNGFYLGN